MPLLNEEQSDGSPEEEDADLLFPGFPMPEGAYGRTLMKQIPLTRWELSGHWPFEPLLGRSQEIGLVLSGTTDWIEAHVPGCVQADLLRAGLIPNPYFGRNSLFCEWVSNRWWVYRCRFPMEAMLQDDRWELCFTGIDYRAHIFLNGHALGIHEGMFRPAMLEATAWLRAGDNELIVMLEHAPDEMSQIGHTSMTHTQKARFGYKWDFSTRLVHLGLYGEVILRTFGKHRLDDVRVFGTPIGADAEETPGGSPHAESAAPPQENAPRNRHNALVSMIWTLHSEAPDAIELCATLSYNGTVLCDTRETHWLQIGENRIERQFPVMDAAIWHPNGHGAHPLYNLLLACTDTDGHRETRTIRLGIRSLSYRNNEGAPTDSLPYTVIMNGKPLYLKGVNLVPIDLMYGAISAERVEQIVRQMADANVNLVRVWGGGLIETDHFYDMCDAHGILVWQEFIQSSSGLDNVPATTPGYLALLAETAESVVRARRNHACLTFWSGGNELMEDDRTPVRLSHPNIRVLDRIVARLDPGRLFLPSSASGPLEFLDPDRPGENHDVHGPWKYGGPSGHYDLFNRSDSLLHSEFGVDGMSSVASLAAFLPSEDLLVTDMKRNQTWRHHGEWWDTLERDSALFGQFPDLETFVQCSQLIQAEGIRYALESNRRRAFANSGSILWQFNEPWPNVACTSIVEWSGRPKAAYAALRSAYRSQMASLRYAQWAWRPGDAFAAAVYLHDEDKPTAGTLTCVVETAEGVRLLSRTVPCVTAGNRSHEACHLQFLVPENSIGFRVALHLLLEDGTEAVSRYDFPICGASGLCNQAFIPWAMQAIRQGDV